MSNHPLRTPFLMHYSFVSNHETEAVDMLWKWESMLGEWRE
jgi:hypothetical protein